MTASASTTASVIASIASRAEAADRGATDLGDDIRLLFKSGILARLSATCTGSGVLEAVRLFRLLGQANLSVGRLAEGHINARRLIRLYGNDDQNTWSDTAASDGDLFGVWGADGTVPVTITGTDGRQVLLAGDKRFCSGLGIVRYAVVTARTAEGVQLVIMDAGDTQRQDASGWNTAGMRATVSGSYDMNNVRAELLGQPGDYPREPWFEGGIWRYAALHCGALETLAREVRENLAGGGDVSQMQAARLVEITSLAQTAKLWVEHAAINVENSTPPDITAALLAREVVETSCLRGIALTERALGTSAFIEGRVVERVRRDLAFFLRQANLDGKMQLAARLILGHGSKEVSP